MSLYSLPMPFTCFVSTTYSLDISVAVNYTLYADNRTSGLPPRATFNSTGGSVISGQTSLSVSTDPCNFRMDEIVYVGAGSNPVSGACPDWSNHCSFHFIASFLILLADGGRTADGSTPSCYGCVCPSRRPTSP